VDLIRIDVATPSRRYPVLVGEGLAGQLGSHLDAIGFPAYRIVVSSPRVWGLYAESLKATIGACPTVIVPDGERSKHLRTVQRIYDGLTAAAADRGSGLVAVGGGVIGDMAGFAAATYLRGVPVAHVPTTLLAQVDSAIGGKTGVNLREGKNLVGAFHQPSAVLVDPGFLVTLNGREYRAGLYEAVKYGVACSLDLFARIERDLDALVARKTAATTPMIVECCRIKAKIVSEDERESGARRVLNFGHTAGHAFEAITAYRRFKHGEAVAIGMRVAMAVALARGVVAASDADRFDALLARMGRLPAIDDLRTPDLLTAAARDKKVVDGQLHFALPTGIGRVEIVTDVTADELRAALVAVGCGG
jgi:3-dehydroquinate synthase